MAKSVSLLGADWIMIPRHSQRLLLLDRPKLFLRWSYLYAKIYVVEIGDVL